MSEDATRLENLDRVSRRRGRKRQGIKEMIKSMNDQVKSEEGNESKLEGWITELDSALEEAWQRGMD